MFEMAESLSICNYVCNNILHNNSFATYQTLINKNLNSFKNNYSSMEDLINHFIQWHSGIKVPSGSSEHYIESPKGEFGVILVSNNSNKPVKCKIRSPSYFNLQALPQLTYGHYLADLAALIGTIDIVFGEIDR